MGRMNRRRLVISIFGFTAGIVTVLVGVFILSTAAGLILTGLTVAAASAVFVQLEEPEK